MVWALICAGVLFVGAVVILAYRQGVDDGRIVERAAWSVRETLRREEERKR